MPDPLAPQDIARRTFDVARRGYEQQEVRGFLHEVSAVVERLVRAEVEARERAERAEARLEMADKPDEATLLEALGEETTRVLTSAREAANEIRTKAEESAARIIAESTTEATETRRRAVEEADALLAETRAEGESILEAARGELDRATAEAGAAAARIRTAAEAEAEAQREQGAADLERARAEAETVLEAARQQGRVMVAEAQAVRERVLRDLAMRRKRARQQVEKLNAGRERLLSAYDVVRRTVEEATTELTVSLSDARAAADAAARRIEDEPEPTLEQLDAEVSTAGLVDLPIADIEVGDDTPGPFSGEVPAVAISVERSAEPAAGGAAEPEATGSSAEIVEPGLDALAGAVPMEQPGPPVVLDERRGRKTRRRKGFEGLPAGELAVVEPPTEGEGVRILAEPAAVPEHQPPTADATVSVSSSDPIPAPPPNGATEATADPSVGETEPVADDDALVDPDGPVTTDTEADQDPPTAPADGPMHEEPAADEADGRADGASPAEPASAEDAAGAAPVEPVPEPPPAKAAEQVFARLRAGQDEAATTAAAPSAPTPGAPEAPEERAAPEADAEQDVSASDGLPAFAARRAALEPIERELARRLKRSLADEQNEVLDLLRRVKPKGIDDLFSSIDDHAGRWADAAALVLHSAARAGAESLGGAEASSTDDLAAELARALTAPLRERIDRSFSASDGNVDDVADRVRALYREWKGQRLAEAVQHYTAAAYARGVFDGVDDGALVHWVVDPAAGPCPDCDDNVLAGEIVKGEAFPTGNPCAPAHPGCHCLVLPVTV